MDVTPKDEEIIKICITSITAHNMRVIGGFGYFPGYILRRCSVARDLLVMYNMHAITGCVLPSHIGRDQISRIATEQLKIMREYAKDMDYCYKTPVHDVYGRGDCIRLAWFRALDKLE